MGLDDFAITDKVGDVVGSIKRGLSIKKSIQSMTMAYAAFFSKACVDATIMLERTHVFL